MSTGLQLVHIADSYGKIKADEMSIHKSQLTPAEKEEAIAAFGKIFKFALVSTLIGIGIFLVGFAYGLTNLVNGNEKLGTLFMIASAGFMVLWLVFVFVYRAKCKAARVWNDYILIVQRGLDGLTPEEREEQGMTKAEQGVLDHYKRIDRKNLIKFLLWLIPVGALSFIIGILPLVVLVIIFMIKMDSSGVDVHRVSTFYYRRGVGFHCAKCRKIAEVKFSDLEEFIMTAPKDELGHPEAICPNCGERVSFFNVSKDLKNYKEYCELLEKYK